MRLLVVLAVLCFSMVYAWGVVSALGMTLWVVPAGLIGGVGVGFALDFLDRHGSRLR